VRYVALGGSNTCGHFIKRSSIHCASHCKCFGANCTFVGMLGDFMKKRGLAEHTKNNCVPAMGPEIVATCLDANVPSDAGYATVEYLPNMNMGNRQEAYSREAYNSLLAGLYARRVRTVVVEVCPDWGPNGGHRMIADAHETNARSAEALGFPVVTAWGFPNITANRLLFGATHLSFEGNQYVAERVAALFTSHRWPWETPTALPAPARAAGAVASTHCALGKELSEHVLVSEGFAEVDIDHGMHATPKVGLVATRPDAHLALCARAAMQRVTSVFYLGFQVSHRKNRPLVGVAAVSCSGSCVCRVLISPARKLFAKDACTASSPCLFDTLREEKITVTQQLRLGVTNTAPLLNQIPFALQPPNCTCQVHIRPALVHEGQNRSRLIVRSLVTADLMQATNMNQITASRLFQIARRLQD